ncbi:MAG: Asp-tRNA(Asn)/Glu-tRNA(Gln) amidotransferase subunit GatC [Acidobacteria bacterium]|nr:Asp-tRNA(Asn)/Glu-tRNA(Gln) amidotransferase subunit GatC [Acidobacteriota bacterium]
MKISCQDVEKIARLANLRFEEQEIEAFRAQFEKILSYMETLNELPSEGIPPTSHPVLPSRNESNAFREDDPKSSLPQDEVLANAPRPGKGHFRVPKVIEKE